MQEVFSWNKSITLTIVISVAVVLILLVVFYFYIPVDKSDINPIEINIEEGSGLESIAQRLSDIGLIRNRTLLMIYVRANGWDDNLKAGRYIFSKSLNISKIVSLIVEGKSEPNDIVVVIPEGVNIWEIDKKLIDLDYISEGEFASKYYYDEGYLFPDTYHISKLKIKNEKVKIIEADLIKELREKMRDNFNKKTGELFKNLSIEKQKEIIVIASILEKEAKTEEDMKLAAGIISKRLELGMPLQVDATVIYGACLRNYQLPTSNFQLVKNCDVTFQSPAVELKIDGPYNTYIRNGLPPGPISNPGLKAIGAALNPTSSDYFYYLSTRDGSQMIYSKTPAEHTAKRRKYLGI